MSRVSNRRNAVIQEEDIKTDKKARVSTNPPQRQRRFRRPATTSHIELIAVAQSKQVKVVLLGTQNVGKTALCVRFMTKRFISEYAKTEMRYNHFTYVDNEIAYFDILDTSYEINMEKSDLYENKIRWGDAFMILFDINDPKSFDEVTRIRLLISHYHTPPRLEFLKHKLKDKIRNANEDREKQVKSDQWFNPPVILVGTHTDKRSKDSIPTKTAKEKAQELECGFTEISNKDSSHDDIRQAFCNLYRSYRAQTHRPRNQKDTKLINVKESSDPRVKPHASPELNRRMNRGMGRVDRMFGSRVARGDPHRGKSPSLGVVS